MKNGFNIGMRTSLDDTWTTPRDFYARLDSEFGFGLDAAALQYSTLVPNNWYGPDHEIESRRDALLCDWQEDSGAKPIWLNPPYGRAIRGFMAKAQAECQKGATVVALVPARTDTAWWHDYCIEHEIRFIRGRLKFGNSMNSAPFPSAVILMRGKK